jgi:hypothetical protein
MSFGIVPHAVSNRSAVLWAAAFGEEPPADGVLALGPAQQAIGSGWEKWPADEAVVWHRRITFDRLEPRRAYEAVIRARGTVQARAEVTTLPARVPDRADRPFTVCLASCFCRLQDEEQRFGSAYRRLPVPGPDVNILCGDQIYLDSPTSEFLGVFAHSDQELRRLFFEHYQQTWPPDGGLRHVLGAAANWFAPDDHEYWNNAPSAAPLVRDSWTDGGRQRMFGLARELYRLFQTTLPARFSVPPLSFYLADTRSERDAGPTRFMTDPQLADLRRWIAGLDGPGVLVLGQPLFSEGHPIVGRFTDYALPDFAQYAALVPAVAAARHSLVVLTGDVHFGRVASCALDSRAQLIEVISSPTALVSRLVGGRYGRPPEVFPAVSVPGVAPKRITDHGFESAENHFLTLEFSAVGAAVRLRIRNWPIDRGGAAFGAPACDDFVLR